MASTIIYALTNYDFTTASNSVLISQVGFNSDGTYYHVGLPRWLTPKNTGSTTGIFTNTLMQGNYSALFQQPDGVQPYPEILFGVPNDTNTYYLPQLMTNSTAVFTNPVAVLGLRAGPGVILSPASGVGLVTVTSTSSGSGGGVAVAAGANTVAATNAVGTNVTVTISVPATNAATANAIVQRDSSGNFSAGTITASLTGNASTATSATSYTGNNAGDVTGPQSATVVAQVGGVSAASVASGANAANAATSAAGSANIVKRASNNSASLNGYQITNLNAVSIFFFGAVGGGADDSAAFIAAEAAGVTVYCPPYTTFSFTNLTVTHNGFGIIGDRTQLAMGGSFAGPMINVSTNVTGFQLRDVVIDGRQIGFNHGSGTNQGTFILTAQTNISFGNTPLRQGLLISAMATNSLVRGVVAQNFSDAAFQITGGDGTFPQPTMGNLVFDNNSAINDGIGLNFTNDGEYMNISGFCARNCGWGANIAAGNTGISASTFTKCGVGINVNGGANSAHGIISGCFINHNAMGFIVQNSGNGMEFIGNDIVANPWCFVTNFTGLHVMGGVFEAQNNLICDGTGASAGVNIIEHICATGSPAVIINVNGGQLFFNEVFPYTLNSTNNFDMTFANSVILAGGASFPGITTNQVLVVKSDGTVGGVPAFSGGGSGMATNAGAATGATLASVTIVSGTASVSAFTNSGVFTNNGAASFATNVSVYGAIGGNDWQIGPDGAGNFSDTAITWDAAGNFSALKFTGSAAGLTGIPAANLTGSVADARLSANVPLLNATSQSFTGTLNVTNLVVTGMTTLANANIAAAHVSGEASGLTNIIGSSLSYTNVGTIAAATNFTVNCGGILTTYLNNQTTDVCFKTITGGFGPASFQIQPSTANINILWPTNSRTCATSGLTLNGSNWLWTLTNGSAAVFVITFNASTNLANNPSGTNVTVGWNVGP